MLLKTKGKFALLDANVVVALLDKKDSLHEEAIKLIKRSKVEKYAILDVILAESYSVIVRRCKERKYNCKKAVKALYDFEQDLPVLSVDLEKYHENVVKNLKKIPELNYNDWILILFAKNNGFDILTLDKKLKKEFEYERKGD